MRKRWGMPVLTFGVVSACATVSARPSVIMLPGVGKAYDQFQFSDAMCRHCGRIPPPRHHARGHACLKFSQA